MSTIQIEANGKIIEAEAGEKLLYALRRAGFEVPTLCNIDGLCASGTCRICVCEVEGQRALVPACAFPVFPGMKVKTHSPRVIRARKTIIELMLSDHHDDCLLCERCGNCELQKLAQQYQVHQRAFIGEKNVFPKDESSLSIVRDPEKCILCGKCIRVCEEIQGVGAINFINRGSKTKVGAAFDMPLAESSCINCGQCVRVCPTGALTYKSHIQRVLDAIADPNKTVCVQHAPAVSVTLGEEFGFKPGDDVAGIMHAALRQIGVDYVFDTSFSADLTIMEEGSELVQRLTQGGALPMFTSCSPGWIKYIEQFHPDFLPNVSSCKSPMSMLAAIVKTFFADKIGKKPQEIFSFAIMPCTAKKFEAARPEMGRDGYQDTDAVLTTRELAQLIKLCGVDMTKIKPEPADTPFAERSTAGKMFGTSGGVMEAAIRSAVYLVTKQELPDLNIVPCRGFEGVKEFKVTIPGTEITLGIAVVSGLDNAGKLIDAIRSGEKTGLHFIEVMTCPGGCVNGGGQPVGTKAEEVKARMVKLYQLDEVESLRLSHKNEEVLRLYDEFLGEPLGHKSHELLHTHYNMRDVVK